MITVLNARGMEDTELFCLIKPNSVSSLMTNGSLSQRTFTLRNSIIYGNTAAYVEPIGTCG